jgi:hypothetical protein
VLTAGLVLSSCKSDKTAKVSDNDEEEVDPNDESFFGNTDAFFTDVKTIEVGTAEEFIKALKNNRHIVITTEETLDLTEALDEMVENGDLENYYDGGEPRYEPGVYFNVEYDGNSLVLNVLHDIYIEGPKGEGASLQVSPRYADVLWFHKCNNIAIKNVTMGHTEAGDCSGDVIRLENSTNVLVKNCALFGCGVNGLSTTDCLGVQVRNSEVFGCSDCAFYFSDTNDVTVKGCKIFENSRAISAWDCEDIIFDDCRFSDHHGQLFTCYSDVLIKNSFIEHHMDDITHNVEFKNCEVEMDYRDAEYMPDVEEDEEE